MNILMLIDGLEYGGAGKIFAFVANGLQERGHQITAFTYASDKVFFYLHSQIDFITGTDLKGGRFTRHIKKLPSVKIIIDKVKPQLIICFTKIPAVLAVLATFSKNIPVVFCERIDPYQYDSLADKAKFFMTRFADGYVFQTEKARQFYSERIQKRSVVIPNPVTGSESEQVPYPLRTNRIVFVGRFQLIQKRQDIMVQAMKLVHESNCDVTLHFYGTGEDMAQVAEQVKREGLQDCVVFEGVTNNTTDAIKDAKVFVLTSDFEGIPNALMEAMSAGVPCVSTDCSPGGARLLIRDKEDGLLVPCGDAKAVANAILFLLGHPDIAQEYGKRAQHIRERFAPEVILDMWEDAVRLFGAEG